MDLQIREDDLTGPEIAALLRFHFDEVSQWSPAASVHALPIERLRAIDVTFFSAWAGDELAGCGALKHLDHTHVEIKSMRADPAWRGKGVGKAILLHLLAEAERRGYARVSLETGRPESFVPARRLYEAHGFAECAPFGDYAPDPFSMCMTRTL